MNEKLNFKRKNDNSMSKIIPKKRWWDEPEPVVNVRLLERPEAFVDDRLVRRNGYAISFSALKRAMLIELDAGSRYGPEYKYLLTVYEGSHDHRTDAHPGVQDESGNWQSAIT